MVRRCRISVSHPQGAAQGCSASQPCSSVFIRGCTSSEPRFDRDAACSGLGLGRLARSATLALLATFALWGPPAWAEPAAPIEARVGNHPGFGRLVFEFPARTAYQQARTGDHLSLRFAGDVTITPPSRPPHNVDAVAAQPGEVDLTVLPGATTHVYWLGDRLVVDILDPVDTASTQQPQTTPPNQGLPNQGLPNQGSPSQGSPSRMSPIQAPLTQGAPNQGSPTQGSPTQGSPTQGSPTSGITDSGVADSGVADPRIATREAAAKCRRGIAAATAPAPDAAGPGRVAGRPRVAGPTRVVAVARIVGRRSPGPCRPDCRGGRT